MMTQKNKDQEGMTGNAPFSQPVLIMPDELIRYIKDSAAEQAAQGARERLSFFFSAVGIVVGLLTAVAAGVLIYIDQRASGQIDEGVKVAVELARLEIQKDFEDDFAEQDRLIEQALARNNKDLAIRFSELQDETKAGLREEVSAVVLLPLLVSEASSIASRGYRNEDRDRIIKVLRDLAPDIVALEGEAGEIAFRRVEDVIDAFYGSGDYHGIYQVYDLFGDALFDAPGIHYTLGRAFASSALYDENFLMAQAARSSDFLARTYDTVDTGIHFGVSMFAVIKTALEDDWDEARLAQRFLDEEANHPGFLKALQDFLQGLRPEFSPGGRNASVFGLSNLDLFEGALLEARSSR